MEGGDGALGCGVRVDGAFEAVGAGHCWEWVNEGIEIQLRVGILVIAVCIASMYGWMIGSLYLSKVSSHWTARILLGLFFDSLALR